MGEFRKNNSKKGRGHPAYIYKKGKKKHNCLMLTHSDKTLNIENVPLNVNPNPDDKRKAYIRPKHIEENKSSFGKKLDDWKFDESDKDTIENIIKRQ